MFRPCIIVLQELLNFGDHQFQVIDDLVGSSIDILINSIHVVSKDNSLSVENDLLSDLEQSLSLTIHEFIEDISVLIVNHTVSKDSGVFMDPQTQQICLGQHCLFVGRTHSLEDLAHISQIESVVRL